ncbi:MAG: hypothetical protein VKO39_01645 [Cyanobacteriota bacterium]|nr:hypothetical protein [Cyanobacteriota bacterium]
MAALLAHGYVRRVSSMELAQPPFSTMPTVQFTLLLGLSGALSVLASQPALAGPNPPLANCIPGTLDSYLFRGCSRGDMTFVFNSYSGGIPLNEVNVRISGSRDSYTVNLTTDDIWAGIGSIGYLVEVNNRSTDLLSSLIGGASATLQPSSFIGNVRATGSNPGTCGSAVLVTSWSCAGDPLTFPIGVVSTTVVNSWNAPNGIDMISNTIRQQPVPGPLPVLGAGLAFGFSRKLRQRCKTCA